MSAVTTLFRTGGNRLFCKREPSVLFYKALGLQFDSVVCNYGLFLPMMRRLREIPCRMLARTAVQLRVLVALIQFATVAKICYLTSIVLLTSTFILWPRCTCGFGIR